MASSPDSSSASTRSAVLPPDRKPSQPDVDTLPTTDADVVVVGAGIVGIHVALQVAKRGIDVTLIDNVVDRKRSYKVGESLLIFGNNFLRTVGELDPFLQKSRKKWGVWFIGGMEGASSFEEANEWALGGIPQRWKDAFTDPGFQRALGTDAHIVRPEAEDHLQATVRSHPRITFHDTARVRSVDIAGDEGAAARDASTHDVVWHCDHDDETRRTKARWVFDCTGRNRFLARRRGHDVEDEVLDDGFETAAVWAQFDDVSDADFDEMWNYRFEDGENVKRDASTIHLWGEGYWIWIIRLEGDRVSVGLTYDKRHTPPGETYQDKFWSVLRRYPFFDGVLTPDNVLESRSFGDVQYLTDTYVSRDRYAMAGDSASLIDAYYSQGISLNLLTSWHTCNIIEKDLNGEPLDVDYIDRVNEATHQDWLILRNTVKQKYTRAIKDGRFFLLSHLLDTALIQAVGYGRFQLARWLYDTGGDTSKEEPWHRSMRENLSQSLFYSRSGPWSWLGPERVQRIQAALQEKAADRARWRLDNDVEVPNVRCIVRFSGPIIKMLRLFGASNLLGSSKTDHVDVTPDDFPEPAFTRLTGDEKRPILLKIATFVTLFQLLALYTYDWTATSLQKLLVALRPSPTPQTATSGSG